MATSTPLSESAQRERESADGRVATGGPSGGETDGAAPREAPLDAPRGALPPTPRAPAVLQTLAWALAPTWFMDRCARSIGDAFSITFSPSGMKLVLVSDPEAVKQ